MKTLLVIVKEPEIFKVPFVSVTNAIGGPSIVVPCTVKFEGFSSRRVEDEDPLLTVRVRTSVIPPVPPNVALEEPVKTMEVPALFEFVLKSSMPLLMRFPPRESTCVVSAPAEFDRKLAEKHPFVSNIATGPKIVLIGDETEVITWLQDNHPELL